MAIGITRKIRITVGMGITQGLAIRIKQEWD
jgi:hypothetical protein